MFKKILFATDGSTASNHAAEIAVKMARSNGASLTAVFVVDPSPHLHIGKTNPLTHVANLSTTGGAMVPFETLLIEDMVAYKGIVQAAEKQNSDLIVIGSHGHKGLKSLFLGSTVTKVLSHSKLPVMVVR
jgi:nucleotide-binding universal stress UspA family protein